MYVNLNTSTAEDGYMPLAPTLQNQYHTILKWLKGNLLSHALKYVNILYFLVMDNRSNVIKRFLNF